MKTHQIALIISKFLGTCLRILLYHYFYMTRRINRNYFHEIFFPEIYPIAVICKIFIVLYKQDVRVAYAKRTSNFFPSKNVITLCSNVTIMMHAYYI